MDGRRPDGPPPAPVLVVTDSTASLPDGAAERWGIGVVPLEVGLGDARYREGVDLDPAQLVAALDGGVRVTTSQPSPRAFVEAYGVAAERGARAVVSVHLSGELSGTVQAAQLAARTAPVPVHVVDSRSVAMGLGFAVLAAARAAADEVGAVVDPATVAGRAREVAAAASALYAVDSMEHLRRGGRVGAATAAVGGLFGVRPLLTVRDGRVELAGTARTRRLARERLLDSAAPDGTGKGRRVRVAVHHLGQPEAAEALAEEVRQRLGDGADVVVAPLSAVVGAHTGPGVLGVVVAPR